MNRRVPWWAWFLLGATCTGVAVGVPLWRYIADVSREWDRTWGYDTD